MDFEYFACDSALQAWAAEGFVDGPLAGEWPFDGFRTRGYDPSLVEAFGVQLTGQSWKAWKSDPRWDQTAPTESDDESAPVVLALTDRLRDALAGSAAENLRVHIGPWVSDNLAGWGWQDVSADDHLSFLFQLQALATRARHRRQGLYCYWRE